MKRRPWSENHPFKLMTFEVLWYRSFFLFVSLLEQKKMNNVSISSVDVKGNICFTMLLFFPSGALSLLCYKKKMHFPHGERYTITYSPVCLLWPTSTRRPVLFSKECGYCVHSVLFYCILFNLKLLLVKLLFLGGVVSVNTECKFWTQW